MKKSVLTFLCLVVLCFFVRGQQALWGGQAILSPEIHVDNTVTFRFLAPDAQILQITGDFLPAQKAKTPFGETEMPGVADLKKNKEGIWEYTTPQPLPSELYSYSFLVDI
jgi:enterochelin esterase family protein